MAIKRHVPKFHRATPAVRREALVEATLSCLKQFGHEGVSVRRISAAAGVSIGLINHHFPSKSGLIAETYETLALSLLDSIRRQAENEAVSPRERLSNFFRASFAPEILDPQLFNVWLVFWSMVAHSAEIRAVHFSTYGKYRSVLESLLGQLVDIRRRAAIQAAPGRDCAVRAARWALGRIEPEPNGLQAARGHRSVRGLGQRAVQRRLSPAVGRRPGQESRIPRRNAVNHSGIRDARPSGALRHVCRLLVAELRPCYTTVQQDSRKAREHGSKALTEQRPGGRHSGRPRRIQPARLDLPGCGLPRSREGTGIRHVLANRLPLERHTQCRRLPHPGFPGRALGCGARPGQQREGVLQCLPAPGGAPAGRRLRALCGTNRVPLSRVDLRSQWPAHRRSASQGIRGFLPGSVRPEAGGDRDLQGIRVRALETGLAGRCRDARAL